MASRIWPIPLTGSGGISLSVPKKSDPQSEVPPVVPVEEIAMTPPPHFLRLRNRAIRLARAAHKTIAPAMPSREKV